MNLKFIIYSIFFVCFCSSLYSQNKSSSDVYVKGHYRNGTYVKGHYRSAPNGTINDNFSTKGNTNPYTGEAGYIQKNSQKRSKTYNSSSSNVSKSRYIKPNNSSRKSKNPSKSKPFLKAKPVNINAYVILRKGAKIRTSPIPCENVVKQLNEDIKIFAYTTKDEYLKIKYGGRILYTSELYLKKNTTQLSQNSNRVIPNFVFTSNQPKEYNDSITIIVQAKVRTSPSPANNTIGYLEKGTNVYAYQIVKDYYKIKYDGKFRYISKVYVKKRNRSVENFPTLNKEKKVQAKIYSLPKETYTCNKEIGFNSGAKIRTSPFPSNNIIKVLNKESNIYVYQLEDGYFKIKYNGVQAYISDLYLTNRVSTLNSIKN